MNTFYNAGQAKRNLMTRFCLLLSCLFLSYFNGYAQQWQYVGAESGVSAGGSSFNNIAKDASGNIYISYYDLSVTKGSVQKYNGTAWSYLGGTAGITTGSATYSSLCADASGNVYYTNQHGYPNSGMEVRKFSANAWTDLPKMTNNTINFQSSAVTPNGTLVAASNEASGTVKRFVNGAWEQIGTTGFAGGVPYYLDMVTGSDNTVYVCYVSGGTVNVMKNSVNATSTEAWTAVGGTTVAPATSSEQFRAAIAIDGANTIYVAYTSLSAAGNKLNVRKFNGTTWTQVGAENFSEYRVHYVNIAVSPAGIPYVIFSNFENAPNNANSVMKFNGTAWETVGTNPVSAGEAKYNNIIFDSNNNLYAAYTDGSLSAKTVVRKFVINEPVVGNGITGYNRDIIANGVGNASASSEMGLDEVNSRALVSLDFKATAGAAAPTRGLPANGVINSVNTAGVTYQLANYTGPNALYLTPSYVTGSVNTVSSGTLSLQAQNKAKVYILYTAAGGGSSNLNYTATVNFSDGTSQAATLTAKDWYSGTGFAIKGIGRVNRANNNLEGDAENPRLYESVINLDTANQSKAITGVSFSFSGDQSAEYGNEIRLAILSVATAEPSAVVQGLSVKTTSGEAAATINTPSGTLDLNAYQNDQYVADNDITWSIVPGGTGFANVAMYGVVTAVSNGTVTVRATLISDPSVFGDFQLTISGQVSGYCEVYFINGCQPASISNFYTTGGTTDINNTSSGCLGSNGLNGYSDYTSTVLGAARNSTVTFNFSFASEAAYAPYLSAWIDWNHDFIFQDSERVFISQEQETDNFVQFSATVPANAVLGQTRMRFKAVGGWEGSGACGYNSFGEIEDYTINILSEGTMAGVTITTPNNTGAAITVNDGTLQLNATVTPTAAPVNWAVISGENKATVDANGLVSATNNGIVIVRASLASNATIHDDIIITITNQIIPVTGVEITPATAQEITVNEGTLQLTATITPTDATNANVTWTIVNGSEFATIDENGLVTAVANGVITVRVTLNADAAIYDEVEIVISNQYVAVTALTVSVADNAAAIITTDGGTLQLEATITPADATNATVTWTIVNDNGLATIDQNGLVTANANGTVAVRATSNDNDTIFDEIEIVISNQYVAVTTLTVSVADVAEAIITTAQGTLQLVAEITPADATNADVTWSIVNGDGLATIDQNGLVTAIANGTLTVRATSEDNNTLFDEIEVVISNQYVAVTALTVSVANDAEAVITTAQGTLQLVATIAPLDASNADVTWSIVSGNEFATIDENGLITAIANGTVVVRATSEDDDTLFDEIQVVINVQTAGLDDHAIAKAVMYPNPSNGIVNISSSVSVKNIAVYTMTGQKVFESNQSVIDISAQQQGIYIVQVTLENGTVATQKLSKI